jgi:hypothetical protein
MEGYEMKEILRANLQNLVLNHGFYDTCQLVLQMKGDNSDALSVLLSDPIQYFRHHKYIYDVMTGEIRDTRKERERASDQKRKTVEALIKQLEDIKGR